MARADGDQAPQPRAAGPKGAVDPGSPRTKRRQGCAHHEESAGPDQADSRRPPARLSGQAQAHDPQASDNGAEAETQPPLVGPPGRPIAVRIAQAQQARATMDSRCDRAVRGTRSVRPRPVGARPFLSPNERQAQGQHQGPGTAPTQAEEPW